MSDTGSTSFENMKMSWRVSETWHCLARLESLKRGQKRTMVKVQPQWVGTTRHHQSLEEVIGECEAQLWAETRAF